MRVKSFRVLPPSGLDRALTILQYYIGYVESSDWSLCVGEHCGRRRTRQATRPRPTCSVGFYTSHAFLDERANFTSDGDMPNTGAPRARERVCEGGGTVAGDDS